MTCPRCAGWVEAEAIQAAPDAGVSWVRQVVCLNCGWRQEPGWTPRPYRPFRQGPRRTRAHPIEAAGRR